MWLMELWGDTFHSTMWISTIQWTEWQKHNLGSSGREVLDQRAGVGGCKRWSQGPRAKAADLRPEQESFGTRGVQPPMDKEDGVWWQGK